MKLYEISAITRRGTIQKLIVCKDDKVLMDKIIQFKNDIGDFYCIDLQELKEIDGYKFKILV